MNTEHLLHEFLALDCGARVRQLLLAEIAKHGGSRVEVVRELMMNRLSIILDFERGEVTVQDDLDASEQGSFKLSVADFAVALDRHKPRR